MSRDESSKYSVNSVNDLLLLSYLIQMPKINECQLGYSQDYTEMNNEFYQRVLLHKQINIYMF